jgi:PAS domain S-box-containing protein
MQIKKRLRINAAVSVVMAVVICLVLFFSLHRVTMANDSAKIAGELIINVLERVTLRNDYLRNNSARAKEQWFARQEQIRGLLKSASEDFRDAEDRKNIGEIIYNHESVGKIFSSIVANREKSGLDLESAVLAREVEERLLSQLNMRVYNEVIHCRKLLESSRKARVSATRLAGQSTVGILSAVIVLAVVNSLTLSRAIANRVQRLRDGAAVIGGGDLDHHIDIKGDDEFVELSEAFNAMTGKLRGSYHNLEMEIEERKRAEEKLREAATELQAANTELDDSRRAAINLMEDALDARRQAEQAAGGLRESEERLRLLIDGAREYAIFMLDADGRVNSWNEGAKRLKGWDAQEILGRHFSLFYTKEAVAAGHPEHELEIAAAEWRHEEEGWRVRKDGSQFMAEAMINAIRDESGKLLGFSKITRDITARKQAEEQIRASLAEKEVLLREIHHRVKNNLQVISSLVSLQADGSTDEAVREVFRDMIYRVRSMALVHEKLYQSADIARIDFAEYARSLLNYLWRAHGSAAATVRLTFNLQPLSLSVDTALPCGLILNELASNALKHAFRGRDEGEVTVSLQGNTDGLVSISLSDNGVGLPEGLDWRQARSLGLRLVQMLAGQLNATVEVNRLDGTEFRITFKQPQMAKDGETIA